MRISFCTTCMDRLFHLEQTLPRNISNASSFKDAEFVLLNYGGRDGLDEWVRKNLSSEMDSGRVSYYSTTEPKYWVAAHAKNIAHRLASGDILCNVDSDILIPEGFCEYISGAFASNPDIIVAFDSADPCGNHGCAGIVACRREHFYSVNGYDEGIRMGWGYDDMNFQFRCRMRNSLELLVPPKMCLCIPHSNEVRTANCQFKEIEATRAMSMQMCERSAEDKDYVANKNSPWGSCSVFKNLSQEIIET
jgi:hypothetical protein